MSTIPGDRRRRSRGACWRPTARWLPAMSRPSTSPPPLDAWRAMLHSRDRRRALLLAPAPGPPGHLFVGQRRGGGRGRLCVPSTRRATGSCRSTASSRRCCARATRSCARCSTSPGSPAGNHRAAASTCCPTRSPWPRRSPTRSAWRGACATRAPTASSACTSATARSSEGDAHEALNLAGVRRAPVVFVLKNNGWAISTPVPQADRRDELRGARGGLRHGRAARRRQRPLRDATTRARARSRGRARARGRR